MNTVTATFQNLDYDKFDMHMAQAKALGLTMESFRVENQMYLNLTLRGDYTKIQAMEKLV